ncbi:MAG: hypothetical protein H2049_13505 [Porphyrobacter sp.]|nr:hypothetical protein [Porphyrobacter sp.]
MKKFILAASVLALMPATGQAQLLGGGGGLGGGLGGSIGGTLDTTTRPTIGSTIDRTSRTVRGTVDSTVNGSASTNGSQSVDARRGTVAADRNASGSLTGSTASLADLVVPSMAGMANATGNGSANGQGSANAQLIGTDSVTSVVMPAAQGAQGLAANAAGTASGTATGMVSNMPMPGMPSLPTAGAVNGNGSGSADPLPVALAMPAIDGTTRSARLAVEPVSEGNGSALFANPLLAVAGSAAAAGQGTATVAPGMPVMTPEGASLGEVRQIVANGRGEVEQVVVKQGNVTRTLPAGMFSASGNALVAGNASGNAVAENAQPVPATDATTE